MVSGKLCGDNKEYVKKVKCETWRQYKNKEQVLDYIEFMDKRKSWTKARRAMYCSPRQEGAQLLLEFARPDTILYTNLVAAYATTVRRKLIDCVAKIVKSSGKIILKVTSATWKNLKFNVLWKRSGAPPLSVWA